MKLLLEQDADPNAREAGDNAYRLRWAAAGGHRDVVQALLDAGGDVHGIGDLHQLDVIGWATVFGTDGGSEDVVSLLAVAARAITSFRRVRSATSN